MELALVERMIPPELLQIIFDHIQVNRLNKLFTVCKRWHTAAYADFTRRLVLEWYNPLREIYIQMISMHEFANDWQYRIQRAAVLSQIETLRDKTEEHREEWLWDAYDDQEIEYACWEDIEI